MSNKEWWRGAVMLQIYPRSYADSNGDGVGDFKGITGKLDYIAALGVDGVWLSPFFKSPMKDFGYDVSDYEDVDPLFGTLADFDEMLAEAHKRNLKVIIDQVYNHCSDQHPWFKESRQSRDNPKAEWFIWRDPKADGTPPNNWQSVFGGPAWSFDMRRGQYYLHSFLPEQPDLNLRNATVVQAILDTGRFWLARGVDGFRLDTICHFMKDDQFRDNPPDPKPVVQQFSSLYPAPYFMQDHIRDKSLPENLDFCKKIRALTDEYPDRMTLGEISDDKEGVAMCARYTSGGDTLHTAYNFHLLGITKPSAGAIRDAVVEFEKQPGDGWVSWAFANHDSVRTASRLLPRGKDGAYTHDPRLSRLVLAIVCTLRGTAFLYQGEELGLPEATIPFDKIQDPWGKYLWPAWQGRDGCRTPMPWRDEKNKAGFTTGEPWLPVPDEHARLAVAAQEKDSASTLSFSRALLQWRRENPVLKTGGIVFHETGNDLLLAYSRQEGDKKILCAFNLGEKPLTLAAKCRDGASSLAFAGQAGTASSGKIQLPAYGFFFGEE